MVFVDRGGDSAELSLSLSLNFNPCTGTMSQTQVQLSQGSAGTFLNKYKYRSSEEPLSCSKALPPSFKPGILGVWMHRLTRAWLLPTAKCWERIRLEFLDAFDTNHIVSAPCLSAGLRQQDRSRRGLLKLSLSQGCSPSCRCLVPGTAQPKFCMILCPLDDLIH